MNIIHYTKASFCQSRYCRNGGYCSAMISAGTALGVDKHKMNDIQYADWCAGVRPETHSRQHLGAGMPAISPHRMQDRYDAIVEAAKSAFSEKGYEATSIADIARTAQISDGLVYRY